MAKVAAEERKETREGSNPFIRLADDGLSPPAFAPSFEFKQRSVTLQSTLQFTREPGGGLCLLRLTPLRQVPSAFGRDS